MKCDFCDEEAVYRGETISGDTYLCEDHQVKAQIDPVFLNRIK
jgi:hypothetical protein